MKYYIYHVVHPLFFAQYSSLYNLKIFKNFKSPENSHFLENPEIPGSSDFFKSFGISGNTRHLREIDQTPGKILDPTQPDIFGLTRKSNRNTSTTSAITPFQNVRY